MDDICKKLHIPNNKESSLAFRTNKAEEEALDKDDERIKRQMRMLQEKKNLHTEAEGNNYNVMVHKDSIFSHSFLYFQYIG